MFYSVDLSIITDFFNFVSLKVNDIIEIALIVLVVYYILKSLKDTRLWIIAKGVLVLSIFYGIAYFASFNVITYIWGAAVTFFAIALVIMFQPELRRLLESLGNKNLSFTKLYKKFKKEKTEEVLYSEKSIEEILKAINVMSKAKTGALILIEKKSPLDDYENSGIMINADISNQLIINIFEKNTPLHDGAMVIKDNKISAATCYLPLSDNRKINKSLGTRHRAAIGASEETDALVLVVSEETGAISIVEDGKIKHDITIEKLREALVDNRVNGLKTSHKESRFSGRKIKLMILSVIFGFLLWAFLTDITNPIVTVDYTIPVEIINEDKLLDTGYVYDVISGGEVSITVRGQRSYINELNENNFKAIANASELSVTNSMNVVVSANKNSNFIEINTHNALTTISIEEAVSTECMIVTEKIGKEPNGYFVAELNPYVKTITITGSKSKIKTISHAVALVSVYDRSYDFSDTVSYTVYDKNGDIVDLSDCEVSMQAVKVDGVVYKTKKIPINIVTTDSSYETCAVSLNDLALSKETIIISADEEVLEKIETFDVELDVSSYEDKINAILDLNNYTPEYVYIADTENELSITCEIDRIVTSELIIPISRIMVKNGECEIERGDEPYKITIEYNAKDKEDITLDKINPYIDIKELRGKHGKVELKFENSSNFKIIETATIGVTIEE